MDRPKVTVNMRELVRIANQVNAEMCEPLAERVASAARSIAPVASGDYRDSIAVTTEPRSGTDDWAHSYVVARDWKAYVIEAKHGVLARALGSVKG